MEDLLKKPFNLRRTEFWTATVLYVFSVFFLFSMAIRGNRVGYVEYGSWSFNEAHVQYSYFANYFFPMIFRYSVLYGGFMLLTLIIVPALLKKENLVLNIFFSIVLFFFIGITFFITDTWLKAYLIAEHHNDLQDFYNRLLRENLIYACWLMMMYLFYTVVKYAAEYILRNTDKIEAKYQLVTRECAVASVVWMIVLLLLMGSNSDSEIIGLWGMIFPFGMFIYWYSFYNLIPQTISNKRKFGTYVWKVFLVVLFGSLPMSLIILIIYNDDEAWAIITLFNAGFQLLIAAPFSWQVFKRRQSTHAELYQLKTELGRSNAGLDFLRSQINPHFLFNSLNTLYGTALQENSDRTANGIQKLGDMMRFMLHENHQDTILLGREIDYLRNYIDLQLLRTQLSPDIRVEVNIDDTLSDKRIAPMLLIPFIENAFKHGISMAKPSWIKMTLLTNENELYFDVYNSIHPKSGDDPEKEHSGIGLSNVKQRLNLVYAGKHKLIIRETAKEFFVHLTIEF